MIRSLAALGLRGAIGALRLSLAAAGRVLDGAEQLLGVDRRDGHAPDVDSAASRAAEPSTGRATAPAPSNGSAASSPPPAATQAPRAGSHAPRAATQAPPASPSPPRAAPPTNPPAEFRSASAPPEPAPAPPEPAPAPPESGPSPDREPGAVAPAPDALAEHVETPHELVAERADPGAGDGAGAELHVQEPWEGYRHLSAADVIDRLAAADESALAVVELYEAAHRRRQSVLEAVRRRRRAAADAGDRP